MARVPWVRRPAWTTWNKPIAAQTSEGPLRWALFSPGRVRWPSEPPPLSDFFIAKAPAGLRFAESFSDTTVMIVVTSCLRATYATGRLLPGLLAILLNLPVFRRLGRGIAVVTEKYTETPSGCGPCSARAAGAMLAPLPFHLRGKHPRRDERAPRSTPTYHIDRSNELTSLQFGSPPSRWPFPRLVLASLAFGRPLQSHPRAA